MRLLLFLETYIVVVFFGYLFWLVTCFFIPQNKNIRDCLINTFGVLCIFILGKGILSMIKDTEKTIEADPEGTSYFLKIWATAITITIFALLYGTYIYGTFEVWTKPHKWPLLLLAILFYTGFIFIAINLVVFLLSLAETAYGYIRKNFTPFLVICFIFIVCSNCSTGPTYSDRAHLITNDESLSPQEKMVRLKVLEIEMAEMAVEQQRRNRAFRAAEASLQDLERSQYYQPRYGY